MVHVYVVCVWRFQFGKGKHRVLIGVLRFSMVVDRGSGLGANRKFSCGWPDLQDTRGTWQRHCASKLNCCSDWFGSFPKEGDPNIDPKIL